MKARVDVSLLGSWQGLLKMALRSIRKLPKNPRWKFLTSAESSRAWPVHSRPLRRQRGALRGQVGALKTRKPTRHFVVEGAEVNKALNENL